MQDENDANENENDENVCRMRMMRMRMMRMVVFHICISFVCRPDVYWRKGRQTVPTGEGKFRIVDGGSLQVLSLSTSQKMPFQFTRNIFSPL